VVATITARTPDGLVTTGVTYSLSSLAGATVAPQTFDPTPEATWIIPTGP
jgi:hypothetical protein